MNYEKFCETYAETLKKYPETRELYFNDFYGFLIGKVTTEKYEKRGKEWFLVSMRREDVTPAYYFNTVDAVSFFRNLGGYERVKRGYCVRGCVPLEITSISPDRKEKTVRKFKLF